MDEAEFAKYVKNNIIPLYPDALDVPGKRVMLKVDSGPGRLNIELLEELASLDGICTQACRTRLQCPRRLIETMALSRPNSETI